MREREREREREERERERERGSERERERRERERERFVSLLEESPFRLINRTLHASPVHTVLPWELIITVGVGWGGEPRASSLYPSSPNATNLNCSGFAWPERCRRT